MPGFDRAIGPAGGALKSAALSAAACLILAGCFGSDDSRPPARPRPSLDAIPEVTRISPPVAAYGFAVSAFGLGFRTGAKVRLDGAAVEVFSVAPDRISFRAVAPEGPRSVTVENQDGTSATVECGLTVLHSTAIGPEISSLSWGLGPVGGGTPLLIRGRNFNAGAAVLVGGVPATGVEVFNSGVIRAISPPCFGPPGLKPVYVTNPGGMYAILPDSYEYADLGSDGAVLFGKVMLEKRQLLPEGLSHQTYRETCPFVRVEAVGNNPLDGSWTSYADAFGCFLLKVKALAQTRLRAFSAARVPPSPVENVQVFNNDSAKSMYGIETAAFEVQAGAAVEVDLLAPSAGPYYPGGAFNVARTAAMSGRFVAVRTGIPLPLLRMFWEAGNAAYLYTSYFTQRDFGSGEVPAMYVLGGVLGWLGVTDTDEYDDSVVAHEFGHFVQFATGVDSSPGGSHGGELLVPNLAFSEGFANWFGCAASGLNRYADTLGYGSGGYMRVRFSPESVWWQYPVVKGAGSEETVTEVLWDMIDGKHPMPDSDGDGVLIDSASILNGVASFNPDLHFTSLETLLDAIAASGDLSQIAMSSLLKSPENHGMQYPPPLGQGFPAELADSADGFVDAVLGWYPADADWRFWLAASKGNPRNGTNGFNSRRYFRFEVMQDCDVKVRLEIKGSGLQPEDLDLYLIDSSHGVLASSASSAAVEEVSYHCLAGRKYFVEVRGWKQTGLGTFAFSSAGFRIGLVRE